MENEKKDIIIAKLPELIDLTTCSPKFLATFLSRKIFSRSDVEKIETEEKREGPLAATKKFYDLLISRSGSFDVLTKALRDTNQTGALDVLNASQLEIPLRFSSKPPKYITDYLSETNGQYLIVCSNDCKITCDWILESTPNCKLYNISKTSGSLNSLGKDIVFLINLDENPNLLHVIEITAQIKAVFVTRLSEVDLLEKLPPPKTAWKVEHDHIQWSDLGMSTKLRIVSRLKQSLNLEDNQLNIELSSIDSKTLVDLTNDKLLTPESLFCDTIPIPISYYVPRILQTRCVISTEIFNDGLRNEFLLLSGIERFQVFDICGQKLADSSSNLLRNKKPIRQLVFLENEMDFDNISIKYPSYSTHQLEYNGNEFIWIKSKGSMLRIQKYVAAQQITLSESQFVSKVLTQTNLNPICIADTPGKGKSILLSKLADELKRHYKTGIVAIITMKELIQDFKEKQSDSTSTVVQTLSRFLSTSSLARIYLNANKCFLKELMLDGFDEVDADDTEFAFKCINQIREKFPGTRLWITSRPHMLSELEICLQTLGYNITPFSKPDQVLFLSSFWSCRLDDCDYEVVSSFADHCLKSLEASLGQTSEDIAGIPLQCLLIGEAYEDDAKRFLQSTTTKIPTFSQEITTVADLYQKLIDKKFEKFQTRYNINNLSKPEVFKAHFQLALQTLFPSYISQFSGTLDHSMSMQEIFDFGLVQAKSVLSSAEFLHRTFAEYFAALFVSESLQKHSTSLLLKFLFTDVMKTIKADIEIGVVHQQIKLQHSKFLHNVICYFLDKFLDTVELNLESYFSGPNSAQIPFMADACVHHNLENLFVQFILPTNLDFIDQAFFFKAVNWVDVHFLSIIARQYILLGNITPIFKIDCYRLNYFGKYTLSSRSSGNSSSTLLHVAVNNGKYATAEFLFTMYFQNSVKLNSCGIYNDLIPLLLDKSNSNNDGILREKILLINFFAKINRDLLIAVDEFGKFPLETKEPHLELIFEVWKVSKNFYSKVNILSKVLEILCQQMSIENLIKILKEMFTGLEKSTIDKVICTDKLWGAFWQKRDLNTDVLEFFKDQCSSFCDVKATQRTEAFTKALGCENEKVLDWLLSNFSYTTDDIKVLLTHCLEKSKDGGVKAISVYLKEQTGLKNLPDFYQMFEFLFSDKNYAFLREALIVSQLVNYFLRTDYSTHFEKMDFEITWMHLIKFGSSYFENLINKNLASESDGNILKLVWITCLCACLKKEIFASKLEFYLNANEMHVSDTTENTLLHYFAQYNMLIGRESFLEKTHFSNNFKNMCESRFGFCVDLMDIWKVLYTYERDICDAIMLAARRNWNMDEIHKLFYLVIKTYKIEIVQKIHERIGINWKRHLETAKIGFTFENEYGNFLDAAIQSGNGDVVDFVIDVLQINTPLLSPPPNCIHRSIKLDCKKYVQVRYVKYLAKTFPDEIHRLVNQSNEENIVPLALAATELNSDMIKVLHEFGANVNATDDNGNTPLHFAMMHNTFSNVDAIDQLMKCGCDINAQNLKKETALSIFAQNASFQGFDAKCFKILIDNKADPSIRDGTGNTSIHYLVQRIVQGKYFQQLVEILVLKGLGDVLNMQNFECQTPLELAETCFHVNNDTNELLIKRGIIK